MPLSRQVTWPYHSQLEGSVAKVRYNSPVRLVAADADAAAAAAAYHIATAGFIGVSRRTQRSDAAAAAGSCVNETNKS
ncbi:unnamed protein product [Brassica napus]|uniref:(rape) hypothetical protein n=1 Tax=Brassica napus TaxID=3708 RepID=A0A816PDF1_BRANA|nr:unnamed protein product [Brassica napus]